MRRADSNSRRLIIDYQDKARTKVRITGERHSFTYNIETPWGVKEAIAIIDAYMESGWIFEAVSGRTIYEALHKRQGTKPTTYNAGRRS